VRGIDPRYRVPEAIAPEAMAGMPKHRPACGPAGSFF
jgi:hypothetical protein